MIKALRNAFLALMFVALPLATSPMLTAHAQDAATPDCTITPTDTATITLAASQGLAQELAARKALLSRVITCASSDAHALQAVLQDTTVDPSAQGLQSQLVSNLGGAINYYHTELAKVNDAGIAETRVIASEVLSWRAANYDPLEGQVNNFILWAGNQSLFTTANARLSQTGSVVSFLQEAGPQTQLADEYASAQALINNANDENSAAKNALLQGLPADQSLSIISQSLQSLSDAYQKFSDISTIVQTLLPTTANSGQ